MALRRLPPCAWGGGGMAFKAIVWVDKKVGPWSWIHDGSQGQPWPEPKQPALLANWFDGGWKIVAAQQIGPIRPATICCCCSGTTERRRSAHDRVVHAPRRKTCAIRSRGQT